MGRLLALSLTLLGLALPVRSELFLVCTFRNVSGPATLDWIGESFAQNTLRALVPRRIRVVSTEERDEAARSLGAVPVTRLNRAALIKLAAEVSATHLIFGEFEWAGEQGATAATDGRLRARAWLVDRDKLLTLLETEEDGNLTDLALIQARLARRIVCAARPARCPSEQEFLSTDPPIRIDAMESYIRGLLASDAAQKHRLLAQAARLAPEFSEPCFELGRMQWEDGSYRVAAEWLIRVSPRDMRWLEAHFLLGLSRYHTGDYAGALAAFELVSRALETGEVWNNIGVVQFRLGRNEALASLSKAIQSDPNETDYRFNAGYVLWRQGDLAGATEQFKEVLKLDPEDVEAQRLLQHCQAGDGPRKGDLGIEGLERLRENYERLATAR